MLPPVAFGQKRGFYTTCFVVSERERKKLERTAACWTKLFFWIWKSRGLFCLFQRGIPEIPKKTVSVAHRKILTKMPKTAYGGAYC